MHNTSPQINRWQTLSPKYGVQLFCKHSFTTLFFIISLFLFFNSNEGYAANTGLEKKEKQVRINIHKLENSILDHKEAIKEDENEEIFLLQELEDLDHKLQKAQDKLNQLIDKIIKEEKLIALQEENLKDVIQAKQKVEAHLKKRMYAYYTMGDVGFLNVSFSSQTLPELLKFRDGFHSLIAYDKDQIALFRTKISDLEKSKKALALEKSILSDFIAEVDQEKIELNSVKAEKQKLIDRIKTQRTLHTQAIKEMQIAAKQLTKNLVVIKKQKEVQNNTFLKNKGKIRPPVNGQLITRFLEDTENALGITRRSMGIALQAEDGTPIVATVDGDVVFSGYMKGYGNTIIIHHGFQYYTVTSRIEKISVKKGQKVKTGRTIGFTGDTATLLEDGLYFEVRHGKKSQDPLLWLDPTQIQP